MTSASALGVGSGRASDVPSEAQAASRSAETLTMVRYRHDSFPGQRYRPAPVPPEARSILQRRVLMAAGYAELADEARELAEESFAAQAEALGETTE